MWDLGRHSPVAVLTSCRNLDPTNFSSPGADDADKETFGSNSQGLRQGLLGPMSPGGPITWKAWVPRLCAMYQLSPHPGHKPPSRRGLNTLGLRQNTRGPSTRLGITIRTLQLRGPEATAPAPTWLLSPQVSPRPLLRGELGKAGNQPDTRGEGE